MCKFLTVCSVKINFVAQNSSVDVPRADKFFSRNFQTSCENNEEHFPSACLAANKNAQTRIWRFRQDQGHYIGVLFYFLPHFLGMVSQHLLILPPPIH